MTTIRVGNGAGFWGDNLDAPRLLAEAGRLDYLTLEYLAELSMSILAHQKSRDPDRGYVSDFLHAAESLVPVLKDQPQLKIITNAGGMNPAACAWKVSEILRTGGLDDAPVAVVTGDDLMTDLDAHLAAGESFAHLDTGEAFETVRPRLVSANAYLGAAGIIDALSQGARIVITGRVADASLTVGPALFEFGWNSDDWDRLAAATAAGHLIECGAQVTGGMFSDWTEEIDLTDIGYPIAELSDDGTVVITKPEHTGGRVSPATVAEQLVYEIGDPAHYLTPDVDADFSHVRLEEDGPDRIRVIGARGRAAPDRYKVSMAYADGWKAVGTLVIAGPNARPKAEICAGIVRERTRRAGFESERVHVEYLGTGDASTYSAPGESPGAKYGEAQTATPAPSLPHAHEVVLRLAVHDRSRGTVERMMRELVPLVTSGPPGVTGYTEARGRPHPVLAFWPTTVDRSRVSPQVAVKPAEEWLR